MVITIAKLRIAHASTPGARKPPGPKKGQVIHAMAGVDALIAPKAFKAKDKELLKLLIDFDLYVKTIKNFFVATGKDTATDKQKLPTNQEQAKHSQLVEQICQM